jgi:hypothetical protein
MKESYENQLSEIKESYENQLSETHEWVRCWHK